MSGKGIRIEGLSKSYGEGDTAVMALKEVNMSVEPGEVVGLIGPSGSGKSTLLKCLGAVIDPSAGRMQLGDEVIFDNGWKVPEILTSGHFAKIEKWREDMAYEHTKNRRPDLLEEK